MDGQGQLAPPRTVYADSLTKMIMEFESMLAAAFEVTVNADIVRSWAPSCYSESLSDDKRHEMTDNMQSDLERHGLKTILH